MVGVELMKGGPPASHSAAHQHSSAVRCSREGCSQFGKRTPPPKRPLPPPTHLQAPQLLGHRHMHRGQRLLLSQQSGLDILRPRDTSRRQSLPMGAGSSGEEAAAVAAAAAEQPQGKRWRSGRCSTSYMAHGAASEHSTRAAGAVYLDFEPANSRSAGHAARCSA